MQYQRNLIDGAFYLLFNSVGSLNEINSKSFGKLSDRYQKFNKIFTTYTGGHQCSLLITKLMEHLNTRILDSAFLLIIRCKWYSKISKIFDMADESIGYQHSAYFQLICNLMMPAAHGWLQQSSITHSQSKMRL